MSILLLTYLNISRTSCRYLLHHEVAEKKSLKTSKNLADLQEKCTALLRRIQNWCEVQLVYILQVASLLSQIETLPQTSTSTAPPSENFPKTIPLFMPFLCPATFVLFL